jgi:hypothetical protein
MNKRGLLVALGIISVLLATVVLLTPLRLLVFGFFSREHFYRGMPSSYWSFTIQNWSRNIDQGRDRPAPGFGTAIGYVGMGGDVPPILRDGKPAVLVLCDLLQDENDFVRFKAAQSLASMGPAAKDAIPVLSDALGGKDASVRYWACIQGGGVKLLLNFTKGLDLDKCTDPRILLTDTGNGYRNKGELYGRFERGVDQEALSQADGSAGGGTDGPLVGGHLGHGDLRGDCQLQWVA